MAATEGERAEIDVLATERAKPALGGVGEEHHKGILQEARLEAAREYFAKKA